MIGDCGKKIKYCSCTLNVSIAVSQNMPFSNHLKTRPLEAYYIYIIIFSVIYKILLKLACFHHAYLLFTSISRLMEIHLVT